MLVAFTKKNIVYTEYSNTGKKQHHNTYCHYMQCTHNLVLVFPIKVNSDLPIKAIFLPKLVFSLSTTHWICINYIFHTKLLIFYVSIIPFSSQTGTHTHAYHMVNTYKLDLDQFFPMHSSSSSQKCQSSLFILCVINFLDPVMSLSQLLSFNLTKEL